MSIFDAFRVTNTNAAPNPTAPAAPAPNSNAPVVPGNLNPPADPAAPGQGVVPGSAVAPAAPPKEDSPLAAYEKLWEPVPKKKEDPTTTAPVPLTAEQVQKAVAKSDFTAVISPDQLKDISSGGEAAQKAFQEAMNAVAQRVMVQATMVSNKLTEKAVADAVENIAVQQAKELPGLLRQQQSTAHLNDTSELFSNPAIKPVVEATQAQLLLKFPEATPAEITKMTQDYIKVMGEQFAPKPPANPNEQDWTKFLD